MYTRSYKGKVKMVILDLAGTLCDGNRDLSRRWPEDDHHGCKGPVLPFFKVFKRHGIHLDWTVIRQHMGMYKPDHLRMLLDHPEAQRQYYQKYGHDYTQAEYISILEEFKILLAKYALDDELAVPVEGAVESVTELREANILVGYDTGYFSGIAYALSQKLEQKYGLYMDFSSNSDIAHGRPSPCMIYDCMTKAKVWPSEAVVKADDTVAGILSGNSAGCWTVGLYASGSHNYEKLMTAKPDYLIPSIKYLPELLFTVLEPRIRRGERPGQGV